MLLIYRKVYEINDSINVECYNHSGNQISMNIHTVKYRRFQNVNKLPTYRQLLLLKNTFIFTIIVKNNIKIIKTYKYLYKSFIKRPIQ